MHAVADLRYDDSADEEAYRSALARIDECDGAVLRYVGENGYHSTMVNDAIARWAYEFRCRLRAARARLQEGFATIGGARDTMRSLRDDFNQNVASALLTPEEEPLRESSKGQMVIIPASGYYMCTPSERCFETLEVQRRTEREDYCKGLLDQFNDQVGQHGSSVQETATEQGTAWSKRFPATPLGPHLPHASQRAASLSGRRRRRTRSSSPWWGQPRRERTGIHYSLRAAWTQPIRRGTRMRTPRHRATTARTRPTPTERPTPDPGESHDGLEHHRRRLGGPARRR